MLKEFKEFALKGNMFDMAVGIVIGAAFATVIGSLVADVFMPIVGQATAGIDLGQLYFVLSEGSPAGP
ncbi:MAG: large conductance mechanosensitive channel protein MscL, partial [Gemmatimonadetes bacterium]|nr:large conductance mechanosensitive channel protein MscL [Gemmatimonadota bacterium]